MKYLVLAGLLLPGAAARPAAAQTARITHLSHSGSVATLSEDEALDNFGLRTKERPEKFTRLNDSVAQVEGQQQVNNGPWRPIKWQQQYHSAHDAETVEQAVKQLRKSYPDAKFIGFEPRHKAGRKKGVGSMIFPTVPPQNPDIWLGLALVFGLAGAGWLLSERARPMTDIAA